MDFELALDRMVTALACTAYGSGGRLWQLTPGMAVGTVAALAGVVDSAGSVSAPSIAAGMAIRVERMRKRPP